MRKMRLNVTGYFPLVDGAVFKWVKDRNEQGLRVKDKFIMVRARKVRDELLASDNYER